MMEAWLRASEMMASSAVKRGSNTPPLASKQAGIEDGILGFEVAGNRLFEFAVQVLGSADEPYGRHAETVCIHRFFGGGDEPGVIRESQVVVGTEVQYFAAFLGNSDGRTLGGDDGTFLLCTIRRP